MTNLLMCIGAALTPFLVIPGYDVRDIKLTVASVIMLLLCMSGLYNGDIKRVPNKWFYLFLCYALTVWIMAPEPKLTMLGMDIGKFWIWQPMFNFLVFGLGMIVIASHEFTAKELKWILNTMMYAGFVTAVYLICQFFNIDQFFNNVGVDELGKVAGAVGNPTHVSPFVAMTIPLAIYLRRYLFSVIMIIAVCLTRSQIAIGAMVVGLLVYGGFQHKKAMIGLLIAGTLFITALTCWIQNNDHYNKLREFTSDNQRFYTYTQVIKDVNAKPYKDVDARFPFTGWGLGNFKYTFHFAHHDDETLMRYHQAHNEYIELLYDIGIVGLFLFLMAIGKFFARKAKLFYFNSLSGLDKALMSGLVMIFISAAGTFIWQIGTTAYFTCIYLGMSYNKGVEDYA